MFYILMFRKHVALKSTKPQDKKVKHRNLPISCLVSFYAPWNYQKNLFSDVFRVYKKISGMKRVNRFSRGDLLLHNLINDVIYWWLNFLQIKECRYHFIKRVIELTIMPMIPVPLVSDSTSITCILCLVCTKTTNIIPTKRTWCNCKRMTNSYLSKTSFTMPCIRSFSQSS